MHWSFNEEQVRQSQIEILRSRRDNGELTLDKLREKNAPFASVVLQTLLSRQLNGPSMLKARFEMNIIP